MLLPAAAGAVSTGEKIPAFTVYAGKTETLNSSELSGKVIILTYESRETVDKNSVFKNKVFEAFPRHSQKQSPVVILAVISCFEFVWPMDRYCISKVQKNARRLRMSLYDDRTGEMLNGFGLKKNESNVLIIGPQGILRYVHAGKIPDNEVERLINMARSLSRGRLTPAKQNSPPPQ